MLYTVKRKKEFNTSFSCRLLDTYEANRAGVISFPGRCVVLEPDGADSVGSPLLSLRTSSSPSTTTPPSWSLSPDWLAESVSLVEASRDSSSSSSSSSEAEERDFLELLLLLLSSGSPWCPFCCSRRERDDDGTSVKFNARTFLPGTLSRAWRASAC